MDGLDHNWFTEAREQETNLRCTGQLRLTDWCPKWVRALGAHLLPYRCTLYGICVEKNAGNSLLGTGGWGTEGSQVAPPCWWGFGVHQCLHLEVCSEEATEFRLGL